MLEGNAFGGVTLLPSGYLHNNHKLMLLNKNKGDLSLLATFLALPNLISILPVSLCLDSRQMDYHLF